MGPSVSGGESGQAASFEASYLAEVSGDGFAATLRTVPSILNCYRPIESRLRGARVLDLGSGPCFPGSLLSAEFGCEVVCIDIARAGLLAGDVLIRRFGADPAKCHRVAGSIVELPVRSSSVDGVVGAGFLHHLADPVQGLREIYRVLKPGGFLLTVNEMTRAAARSPKLPTPWDRPHTYREWNAYARSSRFEIRAIGIGAGPAGRIAPGVVDRWYDRRLNTVRSMVDLLNAVAAARNIVVYLAKPAVGPSVGASVPAAIADP